MQILVTSKLSKCVELERALEEKIGRGTDATFGVTMMLVWVVNHIKIISIIVRKLLRRLLLRNQTDIAKQMTNFYIFYS